MKKYIKYITSIMFAVGLMASCSDFEEVNTNPTAAGADQVQVEYFLNRSISGAQQNPHIAERIFILYWRNAGRFDRTNVLPIGGYNDGWTSDYYSTGYLSGWLTSVNNAIKIADEQLESGSAKTYTNNMKQASRIWRAYLMSEMSDNFGPMPVDGFQGVNPDFNSVQDVYMFMLKELDEAVESMNSETVNDSATQAIDMAYGFDFDKWTKYGNSLRMRLAMRLSEVDAATAKQHFEDAAAGGNFITTWDEAFKVVENNGWNDLTGVMTRQWNHQRISSTITNLMVGLGGVPTANQVGPEMQSYIKPNTYLGSRYENHIATATNDPMAGYWFDGLPEYMDPRAYKAFAIPGDVSNPDFNKYPSWSPSTATNTVRNLLNEDGSVYKEIDAKYTWNGPSYGSWGEKGAKNQMYWWPGSVPRLVNHLRNGSSQRVFFGGWESYFLVAEAAVRGWNVPMSGKEAYEAGIASSFDYWGVGDQLASYVNSTEYNRVGTSVAWTHTAEAADFTATYVDGYTGNEMTTTYHYPDNGVYRGGKNNDLLSKIMTQKFIAQHPWLPLETWSDHRRLGLPFFENPAVEAPLNNMPQLTSSNYMESKVAFFPQRIKYPQNLANNVPEGYAQAIDLLGAGGDEVWTPLWWAQQN